MGDVLNFKFKGYVHYSLDVTHLHVLDILYVAMNEQYRYEIFGPQIHLRFAVFVQEILRRSSEPVYPSIAMRRFGPFFFQSVRIPIRCRMNSSSRRRSFNALCTLLLVQGHYGAILGCSRAAFMLSCHSSFDICHLSSVICHSF